MSKPAPTPDRLVAFINGELLAECVLVNYWMTDKTGHIELVASMQFAPTSADAAAGSLAVKCARGDSVLLKLQWLSSGQSLTCNGNIAKVHASSPIDGTGSVEATFRGINPVAQ